MLRRQWIGLATAALAGAWQRDQPPAAVDTVTAGATADATPRVGIVLSSFAGAEDHDGTELKGLPNPIPPESPAGDDVLREMVSKAIELGTTRRGGLARIVRERDWVVVMPHMAVCRGANGRVILGSVADPRVVRGVIEWLAERRRGSRITIAAAPVWAADPEFDPWESDWDGGFGQSTYRQMIADLGRRHPSIRFDVTDLAQDKTTAVQPPGRFSTPPPAPAVYDYPATLLECDKLITVAPLSTSSRTMVWLSLGSYSRVPRFVGDAGSQEERRGPTDRHELLVNIYSVRPADYAVLGGEWGLEGAGPDARSVHHNLIIGGANSVAVDAVGAAVMGFDPVSVKHLRFAARQGFGIVDTDSVWIRGNEIEEAKRPFRTAKVRPATG